MAIESANEVPTAGSGIVNWARAEMTRSSGKLADWKTEAVESFGLTSGDQWDESDRAALEADSRPIFTFNRIAGFIRGICGLESSSRNQVQFFAREVTDSGVSEVINAAVQWVRDNCDAEDEESDSFKDMLTCGLGWTETFFTTETDPDGVINVERIDPLHMSWDAAARKRGLTDTRWRNRRKYLQLDDIRANWGNDIADQVEALVQSQSDIFEDLNASIHDDTLAANYEGNNESTPVTKGIAVNQFQYTKIQTMVKVIDPFQGQIVEMSVADFEKLNKRLGGMLQGSKFKKKTYWQLIFCGSIEFENLELPCSNFTFQCITGVRDRNKGTWYGFVRDLADPQCWINKFFSSMADVVASQAKGGLMAETDAFVSPRSAEEQWSDPRAILYLRPGGLNKIKERTSAGVPQGLSQLLEFTVDSLPNVAGVNLEFLGLAGREQPGVLEHQRKQAAISTLAEFFNAFRLYRKQQGRVLVEFIDNFISDGRLVRIVGDNNARYVPLVKMPDTLCYDIVVDEAPTSPDQKERTWTALTQILPVAANLGIPVPPEVIEYAPFPQSLIDSWKKLASGSMTIPPQVQAQMQQMQQKMGALEQENQRLKAKEQEALAKLQVQAQASQQSIALEQHKTQAQIDLEYRKLLAEIYLKQQELRANAGLKQEELIHKDALAFVQAGGNPAADQTTQESPANAPKGSLLKSLMGEFGGQQQQTADALQALAEAMGQLAKAHASPKTISDGKGRTFTVSSMGEPQ